MTLLKLIALILTLVFVSSLTVVTAPRAQKREASKEVRSKLFKQLLSDYTELRECVEKEEGGTRAAEEGTTVEEVDLNRDGVPEYEVGPSSACACGMVNCSIYLYRQSAGGYESLLEGASGYGLDLLKTSSNGYADMSVTARDTAATASHTTYKFDGKQYRETGSTIVHQGTGESKPAYRRVQFKRGMSSATVQGKVSIALPDTYLVGARAGQVMTVQLAARSKAVRFVVMSPTTMSLVADNARSWTGTLPETGDYHIIVDADEQGGTYSMTISIK
jgi:hypothetical protein